MTPRNWVVAVIAVVLIIAFIALARGRVRVQVSAADSARTAKWERVL